MSKTFGELLAEEVRERLDTSLMTQRELAEESFPDRKPDSAERRVREILQGKYKNPSPRTYLPICDTLNITRETIRAMKRAASDKADQAEAERQDFEADAGPIPEALDHPEGLTRVQLVFLAELFGAAAPETQSDRALRDFLTQKAEEYRAYRAQIDGLDDRVAAIANLKAAAQDAAAKLNFDEVEELLARVDEVQTEIAVETKAARAQNALMRQRPDDAFKLFRDAALTLETTDPIESARRLTHEYSEALIKHGVRYGGTGLERGAELARLPLSERLFQTEALLWSAGHNHAAIALQTQGTRTPGDPGAALLAEAVNSYRAALRVTTEADHPLRWAMTMQNLGIALEAQGARTPGDPGAALLAEAVDSYRAALRVRTEANHPLQWAMTMQNLAVALQTQGIRTPGEPGAALLADAVESYRAALRVRTEDDHPLDWAATMQNLGNALQTQGTRTPGEPGAALLAEATDSYRATLRVTTEADHPLDWARTMQNLAIVLRNQGFRTPGAPGAALLTEAVESYRAALRITTEADHPLDWAMTMQNLAVALQAQGTRTPGDPGAALLAEAVDSYRAALRVRTEADHPLDWAITQANMAFAEEAISQHDSCTDPAAHLRAAIDHMDAALTVFDDSTGFYFEESTRRRAAMVEALAALDG